MASSESESTQLRADAQRNHESIRQAAIEVFRNHGLGTPLNQVAQAAGVSKGTIYHRFGGRQGLIDAVVEDLVAECLTGIISTVEAIDDPGHRFEEYLRLTWLLQFDEPAANDVLLRTKPDSDKLMALCEKSDRFGRQLLAQAQEVGHVRREIEPEDVFYLIWERGVAMHAGASDAQSRADYERRIDITLRGLRSTHDKQGS